MEFPGSVPEQGRGAADGALLALALLIDAVGLGAKPGGEFLQVPHREPGEVVAERVAGRAGLFFFVLHGGPPLANVAGPALYPEWTEMANALPAEMTVMETPLPGGPEALVPGRRPVPTPGPGEVLIRIASAGINRADCMQRAGNYPLPPGASDIIGLECSGAVAGIGAGVDGWAAGDPVCALLSGDGYCEYTAVPAAQCMAVPDGVDLIDAGGLPETYATVWANVFQTCALRPGETFLVQGGSSGIGTTAIQLAKAWGCTVLATAGSAEKVAACEALGADRGIDYRKEDFVEAAREAAGGADVILDMVGGDYINRQLELLNHGGRLCFVAFMRGSEAEVNFGLVQRKHLVVTGSMLRPRSVEEKGQICKEVADYAWPLFAKGALRPVTHARFPLTQAAEAHRLMESSAHIGKILLVP